MKKLLDRLNDIYRGIKMEKQYLVIQDEAGEFHCFWISDDVSEDATNSSFEKFKEAVTVFKEKKGVKSFIVHNHPKASPQPSLMDYKNAGLLSAWSSILGLPVDDYLIFSAYGYYSFAEAKEWVRPVVRKVRDTWAVNFKLEKFDYENLIKQKEKINKIIKESDEMILVGNKLYYSSCLPLEFIKKEAENEGVKIIFILKHKPEGEKTIQLVDRFLQPVTIIEIFPDGHWETML